MTLDEVHREMEDIQAQQHTKGGTSVLNVFRQSSTLKRLLICSLIYVIRSGGARVAMTAYPHKFFSLFSLPVSVETMTAIRGANDIIWATCGLFVMDSCSRKFLLRWCCWALNACLVIFYFQAPLVQETGKFGQLVVFLTLIAYLGMVTGFLMGLTTICVAETASSNSHYRAVICSIAQFFGSLSSAIYNNLYPLMVATLPARCIFIFMASCLAALSLVASFVPESVGKALHKCDWQESKAQPDYSLVATSETDVSSGDEKA